MNTRYAIQYRYPEHRDAGWLNMSLIFFTIEGAEAKLRELQQEFPDKEWRTEARTETTPYIGNSGTH